MMITWYPLLLGKCVMYNTDVLQAPTIKNTDEKKEETETEINNEYDDENEHKKIQENDETNDAVLDNESDGENDNEIDNKNHSVVISSQSETSIVLMLKEILERMKLTEERDQKRIRSQEQSITDLRKHIAELKTENSALREQLKKQEQYAQEASSQNLTHMTSLGHMILTLGEQMKNTSAQMGQFNSQLMSMFPPAQNHNQPPLIHNITSQVPYNTNQIVTNNQPQNGPQQPAIREAPSDVPTQSQLASSKDTQKSIIGAIYQYINYQYGAGADPYAGDQHMGESFRTHLYEQLHKSYSEKDHPTIRYHAWYYTLDKYNTRVEKENNRFNSHHPAHMNNTASIIDVRGVGISSHTHLPQQPTQLPQQPPQLPQPPQRLPQQPTQLPQQPPQLPQQPPQLPKHYDSRVWASIMGGGRPQ